MRLVPLLALCLALPLAAQTPDPTPPEAYYPLHVGDVREYRGSGLGSPFRPPYILRESVVGDTLVGSQSYRLVKRLLSENGGPLVRSRHAVRFDTAAARPVERLPDGTEAPRALCRLDLADPCANDLGVEPVQIGSDVTERAVRSAFNLVASERYAADIGLVARETDDGADYVERLTFARLGGTTYGEPSTVLPPLAPEPSAYWPLEIGNTWVNRYEGWWARYTWQAVAGLTIVSDTAYAVVQDCRRYDGEAVTCYTGHVRVDDRTGQIMRRIGAGEVPIMCGLRPTAEPGPTACGVYGTEQWNLEIVAPGSVEIAGQTVPTSSIRSISIFDATIRHAAGIGPLPTVGLADIGQLVYARIGGVEYGTNPVSTDALPPSATLALAVAPSPTSGAATLTLALLGPARVVVEAFDALGRRVLVTETDAPAGETRLSVDARDWAPGLYLVRATTDGGAAATARLVRR